MKVKAKRKSGLPGGKGALQPEEYSSFKCAFCFCYYGSDGPQSQTVKRYTVMITKLSRSPRPHTRTPSSCYLLYPTFLSFFSLYKYTFFKKQKWVHTGNASAVYLRRYT